ncbi:T9SS type A sorting domain-containing protein [Flavobacterium beibuense]|uniref:Secretion system C-terminal sorting domain-containing protein n=1 Tax=Flavobacterium beibuense TaxID=657326 RepID=A0A444WES2_9FLAO|nr:T9SS type A sorting domain-containing protein [Flavobacterium beibuense]RYJ44351.1 hypothetical protein NU09_0961 [Flavobacterium beibuense]
MKQKLLKNAKLYLSGLLLSLPLFKAQAQLEFTVDASANWTGYANIFENNETQDYLWGSPWGLGDIKTVINTGDNTVTLYPNYNVYNTGDDPAYWTNDEYGNKVFEGSTYQESLEWVGQDVTFTGYVSSNTLIEDYTAVAFVKALNPDNNYSLDVYATAELIEGENFTITVPADQLTSGLLVQFGFSVTGLNGNPAHENDNGNIVVTEAQELDTDSFSHNTLTLHPNPVSDMLTIANTQLVKNISIYNMMGQKVMENAPQQETAAVNVSSLTSGVYIISVSDSEAETTARFIKQ